MQRRKLKSTSKADFEVAVVGGGPSGSTAALVLARSGARVIVIDKAQFPRDKACGDVIGPKAVRILETLGVSRPADAIDLSDVAIVGPSGAAIRLPSEAGLDYSGIGWSCPRTSFDAHLLQAAVTHGACVRTARVEKIGSDSRRFELRLSDGTEVTSDYLIGADGSNSSTATQLDLVDSASLLLGFAARSYVTGKVELPTISLWNSDKRRLFPGYGWAFPSFGGRLNLGVGVGVGSNRKLGAAATKQVPIYAELLYRTGIIEKPPTLGPLLGGWIKMGSSGTKAALGNALLVGDAAGFVNPLQGEGIAQAIASGKAAAEVILAGYGRPAKQYQNWIDDNLAPYQRAASVLHRLALQSPALASVATSVLFAKPLESVIASTWGIFWNDLADGAGRISGAGSARTLLKMLNYVDLLSNRNAPRP